MKRNTHRKQIINFLMLLLCASLLTGTSFAKETEVVELDREGINLLPYSCTLSDGRVLLAGYRFSGESSSVPKLICLNQDRTVSWDYVGEADENGLFTLAAELQDGTIGACLRRSTGLALRFFTPDGKPAREEIVIPNKYDETDITNVTGSRLQLTHQKLTPTENGYYVDNFEAYLIDWDGNEIAALDEFSMLFTGNPMVDVEDGVLMSGSAKEGSIILKTDFQGNVLWKKTLKCVCPDTAYPTLRSIIPTEDGGYLAVQAELIPDDSGNVYGKYRNVLMKLDGEGNPLWTNSEVFANTTNILHEVTAFNGKYAASFICYADSYEGYTMDRGRKIIWFDGNGTGLGTAEMGMTPENVEILESYLREQAGVREFVPVWFDDNMFSLQDDLWMSGRVMLVDHETGEQIRDSFATILVKVPEP